MSERNIQTLMVAIVLVIVGSIVTQLVTIEVEQAAAEMESALGVKEETKK